MPSRIYLDHNATTPPLPEVIEAMDRCWREGFANPGSRHAEGRAARRVLEQARETIAEILGADPEEVIFTSGGTESINHAVLGLARPRPFIADAPGSQPPLFAATAGEHPATREACRQLEDAGWQEHRLAVDAAGRLRLDSLELAPWDRVRLATLILAHNETGVVQDIGPLADRCIQHNILLHLDAVQAVGKIPLHFHGLKATSLSLAAHKFYGPRGVGALLLRRGVKAAPLLFGGHQESERRPGTEPVALAAGMAKALELAHRDLAVRTRHVQQLRDDFERRLKAECPPVVVHGEGAPRLPNTSSLAFPGVDGDALLVALDLERVSCSLGSTCASGSAEPAPALLAMGCARDLCLSSVRFSLGFQNTQEEIDAAVERIVRLVDRLRRK